MINLDVNLLAIKSKRDEDSAFNIVLESEMWDNIAMLHDRRKAIGLVD